MDSIAYDVVSSKEISSRIAHFFSRFHIGNILRQCNAYKEQGVPTRVCHLAEAKPRALQGLAAVYGIIFIYLRSEDLHR